MAYAKKRKTRAGSRTRRRTFGSRKSPTRRARSSNARRSVGRRRSSRASGGVIRIELVSPPASANVLTDPLMAQKAPQAIKKAMF